MTHSEIIAMMEETELPAIEQLERDIEEALK